MTEEIVSPTPTPEVQPVEEAKASETSKIVENYEALIKQQQSQFEQLMKQQELTNKVNQQLVNQLSSVTKVQATMPVDNEHWIDKVLREEFQYDAKIDPVKHQSDFVNKNTKQIALWWLQYQKDKGLSNEEIANKYYRMMTGVESELDKNQY